MNKTNLLYIIIIILIVFLLISLDKCSKSTKEINNLSYNIKHVNDSTKQWVDKYGIQVATNLNLQGSLKEIKVTNQKDIDNVIKKLEIKEKQIEGLQRTVATSKTSFTTKVDTNHHGDTTQQFTHTQPFVSITEVTIGDSAHIILRDTLPITQVENWSRNWFLGTKVHQVQAYSDRKDVTIIGEHSLTIIKEKPKVLSKAAFIGIGLAAGFLLFHH